MGLGPGAEGNVASSQCGQFQTPATPAPRTSTLEPGPGARPKEVVGLPTLGMSRGGLAHLLSPAPGSQSGVRVCSLCAHQQR